MSRTITMERRLDLRLRATLDRMQAAEIARREVAVAELNAAVADARTPSGDCSHCGDPDHLPWDACPDGYTNRNWSQRVKTVVEMNAEMDARRDAHLRKRYAELGLDLSELPRR